MRRPRSTARAYSAWRATALAALILLVGCDRMRGGDSGVQEPPGEEVLPLPEEEIVVEEAPPEPDPDDDRSLEQRLRDASLAARVRIALVEERRLRPYDIETAADNGVVRLRGYLPSQEAADLAASVARSVRGVREVENLTEIPR